MTTAARVALPPFSSHQEVLFGSERQLQQHVLDERIKIHLFVATLGDSRRMHIRPSLRERQADWFMAR